MAVLPAFDPDSGRLPEGVHPATWEEIVDRFGWTPRRRQLLDGLGEANAGLAAAGCRRIWRNGSFVTVKDEPADFDGCWDTTGVDLDALDPVLFDLSAGRHAQKARFGGELFPNVVEAALPSRSSFRMSATPGARESLSSRSETSSDH
ncbi:MAG: hypothetical protein LC808_02910 [Actinobacteria bacterium]|nr:hypothetical protein [Actinomycetota bacterium]